MKGMTSFVQQIEVHLQVALDSNPCAIISLPVQAAPYVLYISTEAKFSIDEVTEVFHTLLVLSICKSMGK